jgi:hypothetical protein
MFVSLFRLLICDDDNNNTSLLHPMPLLAYTCRGSQVGVTVDPFLFIVDVIWTKRKHAWTVHRPLGQVLYA